MEYFVSRRLLVLEGEEPVFVRCALHRGLDPIIRP